jgi:hypothetical protein
MATARRTATNEVTATYGAAGFGRDFTVLATWESATDIDHTTGHEEVTISNVSVTRFDPGESLTFAPSGATATCLGTNANRSKLWYTVTGGVPTTADTITGVTSGATADIDTIDSTNTGVSHVLACYDDQASFDDILTLETSVNDATYFRIVRPAPGQGHDGTPNNGFHIDSTADAQTLEIREAYSCMHDLIVTQTRNDASSRSAVYFHTVTEKASYVAMIVANCTNSSTGNTDRAYETNSGVDNLCVLCISSDGNTSGNSFRAAPGVNTTYLYNCTGMGAPSIGVYGASGSVVCKNVLSSESGTASRDFFQASGGILSGNNCASEDDRATVYFTSSRANQTFDWVDRGNDDLHLTTADGGARHYGADLSADGFFAFDDDIDWEIVTTWSIGADAQVPDVFIPLPQSLAIAGAGPRALVIPSGLTPPSFPEV